MAGGGKDWRREAAGLWLLYLVSFYPCWWLAQALVGAGPEILHSALEGRAPRIAVSAFGVSGRFGLSGEQLAWTFVLGGAGWAACLAAARLLPALRPVAVFAAAWIAYALLGRGLFPMLFRSELHVESILAATAGFAALVYTLAKLPVPAVAPTLLWRTAAFSGVFLLPLAGWHLAPALLQPGFRPAGFPQLAIAVLAAIVLAARRDSPQGAPSGFRVIPGIVLGVVASVAVFFSAQRAGHAIETRADAERQASLAPIPDPAPLPPVEKGFYYKGVNFTSEWPDPYGSKVAAGVLAKLPSYGVNSVALVPYAGQRPEDAELRFPLRMERDELILATAKMAHAEGLRVLLKPQIWVRGGLYPGDLHYDDPKDLDRWFASYARFVEHYAKLATRMDADMFCVGVEFAQLTDHERAWRELIALARKHYHGPLVYAANFGEEFESVRFWDALDFIGLDNYYPLPDDRSTDAIAEKIERVHLAYRKPILFTEAGFSTYELSHRKPWEDKPGGALSPEAQARDVDAIFRGFQGKPWLRGIFWWKVGASARSGPEDGSHLLWGKPAMDVLRKWFTKPPVSDPAYE